MTQTVAKVELPNGVTLPYAEQGGASGIPVVFVHGIADSRLVFEPLLGLLPGSIHAFVPTQRGHGDASRPQYGYRPTDMAADMAAFMDALGIEAAMVAGVSSGGIVARRFAIDYPRRTLGLALLGSPFTLRGKPRVQEMWDSTFSKLEDPIDPGLVREFVVATVSPGVDPDVLEALVVESLKVPARVWKATMRGLLEDDSSEELHRINAPTLIAWGDEDAILPRSDQEAIAAAITGARLVVYPGAGHSFYWDDPEPFASDLVAFVETLRG